MHGANSDDDIAEIDSHSEFGRNDDAGSAATTHSSGATSSGYGPSPVEVRSAQQARRVDVAGTGGFHRLGGKRH